MRTPILASCALALVMTSSAFAQSAPSDLEVLRNTVVNMLEAMVRQGLISREDAGRIVADAQAKAEAEAAAAPDDAPKPGDVRVTYVPQVVQDEITAQVKQDVQDAVVADVKKAAAEEGWGVPAALPEWIRKTRWSGDIRVRGESTTYADGNPEFAYLDFQAVNDAGGVGRAGADAFLNTTENQLRAQIKASLGAEIDLSSHAAAAIRFGTGNQLTPVTRNQTLGSYDRTFPSCSRRPGSASAPTRARQPSPALLGRPHAEPLPVHRVGVGQRRALQRLQPAVRLEFQRAPGGPRSVRDRRPVPDRRDRAFAGRQVPRGRPARLRARPVAGAAPQPSPATTRKSSCKRRNAPDSTLLDYTAPRFLQKGNTLFDIRNDNDPDTELYALAADYDILDVTASLRWSLRPDLVIDLVANYATNVGYDETEILQRTGALVEEKADAYRVELRIGSPDVARPWAWRAFTAFHYAERDAVLDAFTDSDFHRGGTDAEGFTGAASSAEQHLARLRYPSADGFARHRRPGSS